MTTAETIGVRMCFQYLAERPRSPSKIPPAMTVPMTAPYPFYEAMAVKGTIKVKLAPMKMGSPEPILPMGNVCNNVASPAAAIAFRIRTRISASLTEGTVARVTSVIGTRLVTSIAMTC